MIMAWPIEHVRTALGVPSGGEVTGMKLSLDGRFVEARVEPSGDESLSLRFDDDRMAAEGERSETCRRPT